MMAEEVCSVFESTVVAYRDESSFLASIVLEIKFGETQRGFESPLRSLFRRSVPFDRDSIVKPSHPWGSLGTLGGNETALSRIIFWFESLRV